jgi:uncharacterized protein
MEPDRLEVLSEPACRWLITQQRVGRVAVSVGALPAVFPVNYVVAGDEILFFTAEGTKLRAATDNQIVAFEVDHVDPITETGWSVLVVGMARERTEAAVLAGATAAGLRPWGAGGRPNLVSVTVETLSGRRIGPVDIREAGNPPTAWMIGPRSPISMLAKPPVRADPSASLRAIADLMGAAQVSSVLVGQDQAIVTERDVTSALRAGLSPETSVTAISSIDLVAVDQDATVIQAAAKMLRHEIRHLLVCNHRGQVTGLVTLHDLVRVLLDVMDPAVWVMLRQTVFTPELRD